MPKIMKKNQSHNNFNDSTSESMARNSTSSESSKMVLRGTKKHQSSNAFTLKRNRASTSRNEDPDVIQMMESRMARNSTSLESGKMVLRRPKKHQSSNALTLKCNRASTLRNEDPDLIQMMESFLVEVKRSEMQQRQLIRVCATAFLKTDLKNIEKQCQDIDAGILREQFEKEINPMIRKLINKSADVKKQAKQLSEVISKDVEDRNKMTISHEKNIAELQEQTELQQKGPRKKRNASPKALDQRLATLQTALLQNAKQQEVAKLMPPAIANSV